jgi:xanthine dehydrogenase accessory factor
MQDHFQATNLWEEIARLHREGRDLIVVTVIEARGSTPTDAGAKLIATSDGLHTGTVGGGKIEARTLSEAASLLNSASTTLIHRWNLQRDIGMTCGGEMTLLFEKVSATPPWHLVIFGAGHVSQALIRVLIPLACRIDCIDTRPEWLEKLPTASNLTAHQVGCFEDGVSLVQDTSFVLSITKGHASDFPVLLDVLQRETLVPFIGVIGSLSKRAVLLRELKEVGIPPERLGKLICPLGLPLGSNDPHEIAISIAAQLLSLRK